MVHIVLFYSACWAVAAPNNIKLLLWRWWRERSRRLDGECWKEDFNTSCTVYFLLLCFIVLDNTIFVLLSMYRIVPMMKRKSQLCLISNGHCKYLYNKKRIYLYVGVIAHFLVCLWRMLKHYPSINVQIYLLAGWMQTRPLKCECCTVYPIPFEFCQAWSLLFFSPTMIFAYIWEMPTLKCQYKMSQLYKGIGWDVVG